MINTTAIDEVIKKQRTSILFKTIKNHQLYIRASKRTFCLNNDENFKDKTSFKTMNIKLFKQSYTRKSEVKKINLFLLFSKSKKLKLKEFFNRKYSLFKCV